MDEDRIDYPMFLRVCIAIRKKLGHTGPLVLGFNLNYLPIVSGKGIHAVGDVGIIPLYVNDNVC